MVTPSAKVYMNPGGDEQTVASGGKITVDSGGEIDLSAATGLLTLAAGEIDTAELATDAVTTVKVTDDAIRKWQPPATIR